MVCGAGAGPGAAGSTSPIQLSGSQQLLLDLSGSGRIYQIETSSNLVDWVALLTTNSVISNVTLTTSVAAGLTSEFYRAVDLGPVSGGSPSAVFTLIWPGRPGRPLPSRKLA